MIPIVVNLVYRYSINTIASNVVYYVDTVVDNLVCSIYTNCNSIDTVASNALYSMYTEAGNVVYTIDIVAINVLFYR